MQDFKDIIDDECVYMRNSTTARFMRKGNIFLKFTCGQLLSLINVLYVSSLRRNLVYGEVGLKTIVGEIKLSSLIMGSLLGRDTRIEVCLYSILLLGL